MTDAGGATKWTYTYEPFGAARTAVQGGSNPPTNPMRFAGEQLDATWQALQNDLASLSTDSTHIIATHSGHDIIFERPDLVIAAIKQVITGQKM